MKRKRKICSVCNGNKIIISEKRRNVFDKPGQIMPDRRYFSIFNVSISWPEGRIPPGPDIASDVSAPDLQPGKGEVGFLFF